MKFIYILFLIPILCNAQNTYYVDTDGNDSNPGTFLQPWATWQKGFDMAKPGDTVYFRGGVYYNYDKVILGIYGHGTTGKEDSIITFAGYPDDIVSDNWPILDCKYHCDSMTNQFGRVYNSAIELYQVQYIHLKCLEVRNIYQCDSILNGAITATSVANITYERLKVHNAGTGRGYWHTSGAWSLADVKYAAWFYNGNTQPDTITVNNAIFPQPDTTRWINCDVWDCIDTFRIPMSDAGNGGDAWKTISYIGNYYLWDGCRAWNYSDDGFDPNGGKRIFNDCWAMPSNKYAGFPSTEGNGFKVTNAFGRLPILGFLPDSDSALIVNDSSIQINNCLSIFTPPSKHNSCGFVFGLQSDTTENIRVNNSTVYYTSIAFRNDAGSVVDSLGDVFRNCIAFYVTSNNPSGSPNIWSAEGRPVFITNSTFEWMNGGYYQINSDYDLDSSDFVTTDSITLVNLFTSSRQSDGSLPVNRPLMLNDDSDLIDGGVVAYVGQTHNGTVPDVGYSEWGKPPIANFSASIESIHRGNGVDFTDLSTNVPVSWIWTFVGGTPSTSELQNPTVTYNTVGTYTVSLKSFNTDGSDTETKIGYITVIKDRFNIKR